MKRSQSELIAKKPYFNNSVQFADNLIEDLNVKRAQSFKILNGCNGHNTSMIMIMFIIIIINDYVQQERFNLKKLANKKDGEKIFSN